jgi:hypothetical protein
MKGSRSAPQAPHTGFKLAIFGHIIRDGSPSIKSLPIDICSATIICVWTRVDLSMRDPSPRLVVSSRYTIETQVRDLSHQSSLTLPSHHELLNSIQSWQEARVDISRIVKREKTPFQVDERYGNDIRALAPCSCLSFTRCAGACMCYTLEPDNDN